ncbi:MAG: ankyrin repeat domain-containing protein [Acidiferrobacterales bacterium]|nr:ankyrin repeat domain-containing protein [Acidiferrobacterales bacterium]
MLNDSFRLLIERGDVHGIEETLETNSHLVNQTITWYLNQTNHSDPLHFVCDCVFNGHLQEEQAERVAALLIKHGAKLNGSEDRESPLIAATSLGVESVAKRLIEAGADLELKSVFGGRALHWAASMGLPSTVKHLVDCGADIEAKCTEFGATPLYWAIVGFGPNGPNKKKDPLLAAKVLVDFGANVDTSNNEGLSAIQCAQSFESDEMLQLLTRKAAST